MKGSPVQTVIIVYFSCFLSFIIQYKKYYSFIILVNKKYTNVFSCANMTYMAHIDTGMSVSFSYFLPCYCLFGKSLNDRKAW
jgi:hypothetical protein